MDKEYDPLNIFPFFTPPVQKNQQDISPNKAWEILLQKQMKKLEDPKPLSEEEKNDILKNLIPVSSIDMDNSSNNDKEQIKYFHKKIEQIIPILKNNILLIQGNTKYGKCSINPTAVTLEYPEGNTIKYFFIAGGISTISDDSKIQPPPLKEVIKTFKLNKNCKK